MSPELIGGIGFAGLIVLLTLGIPMGAALGLVGMAGLAMVISPEAALIKAGVICFDTMSRYELGVLPLFMLMAQLCFAAGAAASRSPRWPAAQASARSADRASPRSPR